MRARAAATRKMRNHRTATRLSALLFCIAFPAFPQAAAYEGRRIAAVEYEPARQPLSPADLDRVQLVRKGNVLHAADVGETIDRMFATGRYEDIQVDAEPGSASGVVIRFITRDARFVGHISVSGKTSNPPGRGQIVDAAELTLGTPFREDALKLAQENIQQLFTNNGLYQATVHLETINDPAAQQVDVRIVVTTGKRARYEKPEIRGDTKLPDNTIIRATGWRVWLIGRWRLVTESLTDGGVQGVQKKYQSKDRLAADVDMESLDYNRQTNRVKAELHIDAGPKIQVKALEAKVSKGKLRRYVPIYQEGAVDQDLLVEGARNLRDYFQSKGYPDVDVTCRELPVHNDEETIE